MNRSLLGGEEGRGHYGKRDSRSRDIGAGRAWETVKSMCLQVVGGGDPAGSPHPWKRFLSDPSSQGMSSSLPVCLWSIALEVLSG